MATIINTVSDTKFSLNGITYGKIYQPLAQGTEHISIVNVYDTSQKLVNSTHYSEFNVNGSTYIDQDTLISALILVIFTLGESGGSGGGAWGEIEGTLSDQGDLWSALGGKANTSHTHSIANITGLQTALDGKIDTGDSIPWATLTGVPSTFAPSAHTHTISNITGLQTALDGKASSSHTHTTSQITNLSSYTGFDSRYLGISAKAADSNLLDGIDSASFLRSDANDLKTAGYLRFNDNLELQFGSGNDSNIFHNGSHTYWDLVAGNLYIRDNTTTRITFSRTDGRITAGSFYESSDRSLKENIEYLTPDFVKFNFKNCPHQPRYGVIAQDIEVEHPELVQTDENGLKAVNYIDLLVLKVVELQKEVKYLKSQING